MVLPTGSIVNAAAVLFGGCLGMLLGNRMSERIRLIVFQGLGLCTLAIGIRMTLQTTNPLYMTASILLGAVIGELFRLEEAVLRGGEAVKRTMRSDNARFTDGFVTASLLFCIGAMAIVGPLQEGLEGDRTIVLAKSMLDFFAAIALGAAYGSGILFAALPVLVYQGGITLFAEVLRPYLSELIRAELSATGGVMILAIGLNLLELTRIRLSNLLPALLIVLILCAMVTALQG